MRKYNYLQIFDEDGNTAIIQSYVEDAQEYIENIYTDGTPEMESYVYELGYRKWWDEEDLDECDYCDGNCAECELDDFEDDYDIECEDFEDDTNGFSYMESDENSDCRYSFYSSDKELVKEAMNRIVKSK